MLKKGKIEKPGYSIELISNDIIYVKFDGSVKIDLPKAKVLKQEILQLVNNKPFKNLVEFNNKSGILTSEAKKFNAFDLDFKRLKICEALVTKSFSTAMLIGFFLKVVVPKTPTKAFTHYKDALIWFRTF